MKLSTRVGLALLCPVTSRVKGYPFEVTVPQGLPIGGVVLADQVKSLDWRSRNAEFAGKMSEASVDGVLAKLDVLLRR